VKEEQMKEKIELHDLKGLLTSDRRILGRKEIGSPIKVKFSLEYEGELVDISKKGIGVKFHPLKTSSLDVGTNLRVHIDMHDRLISVQGEIRRISEKFGFIVVGLQYDRDEIATFSFAKPSNASEENLDDSTELKST
jgi:hypothetical protein